ncbi:superinfection immunity protein [Cellulomonas composti]|uniref:DUF2510 domain-containing protein n=1 Tax=Cellulomonas composti TaxID=266130 RepID=A0A511JDK1_9CELL|nr:superinfection immunity protein [Cellulomonas composti]GEL96078.1 hypothetical protein CCO02nite_27360 [Cellulomonas composti]
MSNDHPVEHKTVPVPLYDAPLPAATPAYGTPAYGTPSAPVSGAPSSAPVQDMVTGAYTPRAPQVYVQSSYPTSPQYTQAGWVPVCTDRVPPNAAVVVIAWVVAFFTFGYMLPWAIAATRGRSNRWAIFVLNLLLGWSFIGWVASLVMACMSHSVVAGGPVNIVVAQVNAPPPGWYPSPSGAGSEYWDGARWTGHRAP